MTLFSMSSYSSVDRVPPSVQEVMGLIPVRDLLADFFGCPMLPFTLIIY